MAKAGKKGGTGGQTGSRTGAGRGAAVRKVAPKRSGTPAVEAVVVEAVGVAPTASVAEADNLARAVREALAEVKSLREQVRAARAEADGARTAYRDAMAEALASARRLKAEFESLRAQATQARGDSDASGAGGAAEPVRKNRFGVTVAPGVVVAEVLADSPAAAAAVIRGDVIEEANGRPVYSGGDLRDAVEAAPDEGEVTLQLRRAGELLIRTVHIPAPDTEGGEGASRFGVTVAPGVVVAEVFPGSPAAAAGLERGDLIEEAHGQAVVSGDELLTVVHSLPEGSEVPLVVTRAGVRRELTARLDGA